MIRYLKLLLVVPVILAVRLLKPFILIRFCQLNSSVIGMFGITPELYLCKKDTDSSRKIVWDLFCCDNTISNQQLKIMWSRVLTISPMVELLARVNRLIPGGEAHILVLQNDEDFEGLIPRSETHLQFEPLEECLGEALLLDLGIPRGKPFICINARDSSFKESKGLNDSLHTYRNASIKDYILMAEEMVHRGYYVVRIGAEIDEPLVVNNPMIIDYASESRTDFMDIYLCAKCSFFVSSTSGLHAVARLFRRPVVCVNFVPVYSRHIVAFSSPCLLIPKHLRLRATGTFMTFPEFISRWSEPFDGSYYFERLGVEVIDNTPQEILDVVIEMEEHLTGRYDFS